MEEYTIYCTKEQTKKAFELGANLFCLDRMQSEAFDENPFKDDYTDRTKLNIGVYAFCPTAEQLINWLRREKGFKFLLFDAPDSVDDDNWWLGLNGELISSGNDEDKELAAINAALNYLIQNKK